MTISDLQDKVAAELQSLLSRPLVAFGDSKDYLTGLLSYVRSMNNLELQRLLSYLPAKYRSRGAVSDPE